MTIPQDCTKVRIECIGAEFSDIIYIPKIGEVYDSNNNYLGRGIIIDDCLEIHNDVVHSYISIPLA